LVSIQSRVPGFAFSVVMTFDEEAASPSCADIARDPVVAMNCLRFIMEALLGSSDFMTA
jgi:hypothetical protein